MRGRAVDFDLREERKGDAEVRPAELRLISGLRTRLLVTELVARKPEHQKTVPLVFAVKRLEPLVLRRKAALARHVDDEQRLARVFAEPPSSTVNRRRAELVNAHPTFPSRLRTGSRRLAAARSSDVFYIRIAQCQSATKSRSSSGGSSGASMSIGSSGALESVCQ